MCFKKLAILFSISLSLTGLIGCTTDPGPRPNYYAEELQSHVPEIHSIALVTDLSPPSIESVGLDVGRGESAAGMAAEGAFKGVFTGAAYSLIYGPAFFIVLPFIVATGTVGGAITGAASGYSAEMLAKVEALVEHILNSAYYQNILIAKVDAYAKDHIELKFIRMPSADQDVLLDKPDYSNLTDEAIDAVLEVELLQLALIESANKKIKLTMAARVRLVSTHTNVVLSDNQYKYSSFDYKLEKWFANDAGLLSIEIQRGLQWLAEAAVDENFLLFYPKAHKTVPSALNLENLGAPYYVLAPVYSDKNDPYYWVEELGGLQPTLRWESFPREYDLIGGDGQPHKITNVRYELRVMTPAPIRKVFGDMISVPIEQIYHVRDIPQPYYKIENSLNPCSTYIWTVRARFEIDGRDRVTEWAGTYAEYGTYRRPWVMRREYGEPEALYFYKMETPCDNKKIVEPYKSISVEEDF